LQQARAAGLEAEDAFALCQDYAQTRRRWSHALEAPRKQALDSGFDGRRIKI
jgi:cyclopropane fatty-acyl-phospholipid synthase-like methyltransferase